MSVAAPARAALPPGTVIRYLGVEATILRDEGGPSFQVAVSGEDSIEDWAWVCDGVACEVVRLGPDNVLMERKTLERLLEIACTHVHDIETGLKDGSCQQDDHRDLAEKRAVIAVAASLLDGSETHSPR